jgi:hypothetical protein
MQLFLQLDLVIWLRENGCELDYRAISHAAYNGHLAVIQWLKENGCDWNAEATTFAAENGQLEVLQWLRENDCPWDSPALFHAVYNGHLHIAKWIVENGGKRDWQIIMRNSGSNKHVEWLANRQKNYFRNAFHWFVRSFSNWITELLGTTNP